MPYYTGRKTLVLCATLNNRHNRYDRIAQENGKRTAESGEGTSDGKVYREVSFNVSPLSRRALGFDTPRELVAAG